jgi:hypothetical protein
VQGPAAGELVELRTAGEAVREHDVVRACVAYGRLNRPNSVRITASRERTRAWSRDRSGSGASSSAEAVNRSPAAVMTSRETTLSPL